ncbi:MAG: aminoacyl-tRNA hydrolase [Mycobacteriales bacterium]
MRLRRPDPEPDPAAPYLIVGLGNPGPRYATTRHSAGFLVLDELADRVGGRFKAHSARAEAIQGRLCGERVVLAKPLSFMNESGGPVAGLRRFFRVPVERIVVVHDELDLDLGTVRLKLGGGDNGHNGLRSITRSLGGPDYYRVRVGIGGTTGRQDQTDHVLRDFAGPERTSLPGVVDTAADATELLITQGLERAQNAIH